MAAVGQGTHWTVTNADDRAKICWESTATGYWFWADAQDTCPRLGKTWNDLTTKFHLLSLEEYIILWHAVKIEFNRKLDVPFWTWLRTRYGSGALDATGYDGEVAVRRRSAEPLPIPLGYEGGRVADVVT